MRLRRLLLLAAMLTMLMVGLALSTGVVLAHGGEHHYHPPDLPAATGASAASATVPFELAPTAACAGGPTIDGILLDECLVRSFVIDGVTKSVTVWYTKNPVTATRMVNGSPVVLSHWINTDAQAQQVAAWFETAWRRYHTDSGHHLYDIGCSDNVNVQMEDGVGWSGIAYWASSGNCNIGIDSPMVRGGGGEWTVYHEAQHYLQYSWNDGCYGFLKPNYPDDSEFVEGYADLGADSVNATVDAIGFAGIGYNNHTSMYDKSYGNLFLKYFIEQLGDYATPADPWHNINAMYAHYDECDAQDTLYVLHSLIPALSGGALSKNEFFLNFFAANWAKDWADPATQEELIYYDDDAAPYAQPTLTQNVSMSGGSQNWSDTTPDDYAARYYQITPQAGCPYLQMEVDGEAGALLGINFMAAKTSAPTSVLRSAHIGNGYVRTFAANGVHDRLVTVVNAFTNNYAYDVTATCVSPALDIREPKQTAFALVGAPDSPIAFLARWSVTDGIAGVRGLEEGNFSFSVDDNNGTTAAATLVPGTFQTVGDEYWAVLLPPTMPLGTTFADLQICLDGSICDSENNALLYVDPGNTDIALVFDGSGSMNDEDITGEGTRLKNAQSAGLVIADLLRPGDRILVTDFSAEDSPGGCGTPTGDHDCQLDIITRLPRTNVPDPAAPTIANTRNAINSTTAREWTPIGAALDHAKDELLKEPGSLNPKHIFLLSDGEENAKPFYADVKADLINSGVVINTIGFGPEAPGNLLAQIAADTGGVYRPVPTTAQGASVAAASMPADIPAEIAAVMAAPVMPGQLGLADVYDYFDTQAQDATRMFQKNYTVNSSNCTWTEEYVHVDESANQLRFVLSAKQEEGTGAWNRITQVQPPNEFGRKGQWYDISPAHNDPPPPAKWDIRNDGFNDVLIVPNPRAGEWGFRSCTYENIIIKAAAPAAVQTNFMMAVSLQSEIRLQGQILGLNANQGVAGDKVTILGYLLSKEGLLPASTMTARVVSGGGLLLLTMYDDGLHNDGVAGDGIYGTFYSQTYTGGGYDVKIMATMPDPNQPSVQIMREWNGGFWIKGPRPDIKETDEREDREQDTDGDGMPDAWEIRCKLDPNNPNDAGDDPDRDGLTNLAEWHLGTLPCDADTDKGGENDGSEVRNGRDPLNPTDDTIIPLVKVNLRPLNSRVLVNWSPVITNVNVLLYISTDINDPGQPTDMGSKGDYLVESLQNGTTYYVWLQPESGGARGPLTQPEAVTPKADPDAPAGAMLIEDGAPSTTSKQVTLNLTSTDEPLDGVAQSANAHQTDMLSTLYNTVSGNIEMRISNHASMDGATWEPLKQFKEWTLDCAVGEICVVYAQFRDQAGNESLIVYDEILLTEAQNPPSSASDIFLPLLSTP